jgi:hypothetical protein
LFLLHNAIIHHRRYLQSQFRKFPLEIIASKWATEADHSCINCGVCENIPAMEEHFDAPPEYYACFTDEDGKMCWGYVGRLTDHQADLVREEYLKTFGKSVVLQSSENLREQWQEDKVRAIEESPDYPKHASEEERLSHIIGILLDDPVEKTQMRFKLSLDEQALTSVQQEALDKCDGIADRVQEADGYKVQKEKSDAVNGMQVIEAINRSTEAFEKCAARLDEAFPPPIQKPLTTNEVPNFDKDGFWETVNKFSDRTKYKVSTLKKHREAISDPIPLEGSTIKKSCVGHFFRPITKSSTSSYEYFVYDDPGKARLLNNPHPKED